MECWASEDANSYADLGESTKCKGLGWGGPWANDVYEIKQGCPEGSILENEKCYCKLFKQV